MSNKEETTVDTSSPTTASEMVTDQANTDSSPSPVKERKQSAYSFRFMESEKESESDKDLIIHSLNESLHIHKEILERIQSEKESYQQQIEQEREQEKQKMEDWRQTAEYALEEQNNYCFELEQGIEKLRKELEAKKEDYRKLEIKFYSYVKQIRVTDDDLSTIQPEISHLLSQLNNTCMGLKSKMNREKGTQFVFERWQDRIDLIKKYMMPAEGSELLDTSYITFFVEKYLIETLLHHLMDVPIHLGVSINNDFEAVNDWMASRNKEWSNRLRQQVCALVIQQPGDEEARITEAKNQLLQEIVETLGPVYPSLKQDPKKIENLIQRTSKLNLAVKGQEIKIERLSIEEGVTKFDSESMKATVKGKPDGIVFLAITPPFVARDEIDNEHGFTVPGKVFCIEDEQQKEEDDNTVEDNNTVKDNKDQEESQDEDQEMNQVSEQRIEAKDIDKETIE